MRFKIFVPLYLIKTWKSVVVLVLLDSHGNVFGQSIKSIIKLNVWPSHTENDLQQEQNFSICSAIKFKTIKRIQRFLRLMCSYVLSLLMTWLNMTNHQIFNTSNTTEKKRTVYHSEALELAFGFKWGSSCFSIFNFLCNVFGYYMHCLSFGQLSDLLRFRILLITLVSPFCGK